MVTEAWRHYNRRRTAAQAAAENPTLAAGELLVELDTFGIKAGDGSTPYAGLPYVTPYRGDLTMQAATISGGTATNGVIRSTHSIQVPWSYTQTTDPTDVAVGTALNIDLDVALSGGAAGPAISTGGGYGPRGLINIEGIVRYNASQTALSPGAITGIDLLTEANQAGQARNMIPGLGWTCARSVVADAATVTFLGGDVPGAGRPGFVDSCVYATVDSGTLDGITNSYKHESFLSMGPFLAGNSSMFRSVGLRVMGPYKGIHPSIPNPSGTHWSGAGTYDATTTPTLTEAFGVVIDRFTLGTLKVGVRSQHRVELYTETASFDAAAMRAIEFGPASAGPTVNADIADWSVNVLNCTAVINASENSNVFGSGALFNSTMIFKNANGQAQTMAGLHGCSIATRIRADGAALTTSDHFAYADRMVFERINAGTVTADEITGYLSLPVVDTGVTANIRRAVHVGDVGGGGTLTTNVGIDISTLAKGGTNIGIRNASTEIATPSVQTLTAVGNAIVANAKVKRLDNTSGGSLTLTSAPTIADGQDGQILILFNSSAQNVVLQDQGTLANSNLRLSATTITLSQRDSIELIFSSTVGDWVQIGQVNVL
jgi:Major tropism determinant N-terminal domain